MDRFTSWGGTRGRIGFPVRFRTAPQYPRSGR
nr:MAG TPA: hypothetical protein [Caudoviricetes sp.]